MCEINCSKCEKPATEGSLKHPYCKEHFGKLFGNDNSEYLKFLSSVHNIF